MFTILIPKIKSCYKRKHKRVDVAGFLDFSLLCFPFFILRFTLIQTNVNNNANLIVKQILALKRGYMIIYV